MDLEFDVLGIAGKLVIMWFIHLRNRILKNDFSLHMVPKQQTISFGSEGISRFKYSCPKINVFLYIKEFIRVST